MRIAAAALVAALGVAGVVRGHDGGDGRYATAVGEEVLPGVVVAAQRGGRYSADLYLTAALVPLRPLGDRVREAVVRGVGAAGLEQALGPVGVTFLSVEKSVGHP
jgi:hypothetical protein